MGVQPISRERFAVTIAIVVGMVCNMVVLQIGMQVYPPPADLDPNDATQMSQWVQVMSLPQLLFVFVAHITQAGCGALAGCWSSRDNALRTGRLVGMISALFCGLNLFLVPHPTWFWTEIPLCLAFGLGIGRVLQIPPNNQE